jgi:hypothetical protein
MNLKYRIEIKPLLSLFNSLQFQKFNFNLIFISINQCLIEWKNGRWYCANGPNSVGLLWLTQPLWAGGPS